MLGEGARTDADALKYLSSCKNAIQSIAATAHSTGACEVNDGISIKLSALHPRYEDAQKARVLAELVPRVWGLCQQAARANINLTIDAEEVDRQELGLPAYPVFTHKHHTDVSYLACARALLDAPDALYPQFATHNAATIAAILQMGAKSVAPFELQRLHGMGEGICREVLKNPLFACRVYAPVGAHKDLLAYLVRRLLENGANSSFVHQLADESVGMQELLISPLRLEPESSLPLPLELFGTAR